MPFAARTSPRLSPRAAGALISLAMLAPAGALAQQAFPSQVDAALARAKVPREAVTMLVADADGSRPPRLAWRTQVPVNPASIMKLVTTYAALDLLGPAYNWTTPVYTDGTVSNGVLNGNLYIKGQGDPKLVLERMWLLLRHVQGLGITTVNGDIVIDRSAFENTVEGDPAAFDGEPLRPYNASPDALLVNFKSVNMSFAPDRAGQFARVNYEPPLASVAMPATVPLVPGECGDWRTALRADFADVNRIRFNGGFPAGCGERSWAVAYADPRTYSLRAIGGMWAEMGGRVGGQMREGRVPAGLKPAFEFESPPLAEVVRDINKYSNNVMARQLFLSLAAERPATPEGARRRVADWLAGKALQLPELVLDNGSGLSRTERISAAGLGDLLLAAWRSPVMPELMASLPLAGVDGTLKKRLGDSPAAGRAHLKTGYLEGVRALAGYVLDASGRRWVVVCLINGPRAQAGKPAMDALLRWVAER